MPNSLFNFFSKIMSHAKDKTKDKLIISLQKKLFFDLFEIVKFEK